MITGDGPAATSPAPEYSTRDREANSSAKDADQAASGRLVRVLGTLAVVAVLSGIVPTMLVAQVGDVGRSDAWRLTLALTMWAGVRLALAIASGRPMLFDFFFWLFTYIFMGLAPTVQIRTGLTSTTTPGIDVGLDEATAMLVWLGVICYEIGRLCALALERRHTAAFGRDARAFVDVPRSWMTKVSSRKTLILLAIGAVASAYFIYRIGIGSLFGSRETAQAARAVAWPDPAVRSIMYAAAIYPLLVGIGGLAQLRRLARRPRAGWYTVLLVGAMLLLLIVVNPLSSARYSLGTVLFALAVYWGAVVSPGRVRITLIAAVAGFVFLFPLADAFRRSTVAAAREGFFGEYKSNPDYDAFWQIANTYSYLLDGLLEGGRQLLGVLLFWVPRSAWPDKPVDTGILLAQYRGYSFDNLSAPLWAEFLINGGVAALVIGFLAVGFVLRWMDKKLLSAFAQAGYWAIVGAIFPVYMTILLRGSLLQATGAVAVTIACILLVRERPSPSRQSDISRRRLFPVAPRPPTYPDSAG